MSDFTNLIIISGLVLLGVGIHLIPFLSGKREVGVDHWFWLGYIQHFREKAGFRKRMPNYVLESAQLYPPLFPLILSRLSSQFLSHYTHHISVFINLLRLLFLFLLIKITKLDYPIVYLVAGLSYITMPILISYNSQLNPRGVGALLLDGLMVWFLLWQGHPHTSVYWLGAVLIVSLILLTHRMTTQIMFFVICFFAVVQKEWILLLLIPGGILCALLLSGGHYGYVLKAHFQIIEYWTQEWPLNGADPIRESPRYGRENYKSTTRLYEPGLGNFLKRLLSIFIGNYAPLATGILVFSLYRGLSEIKLPFVDLWLFSCMLFTVLTVMVPFLRGLGYGNLYLFNAAFPAAYLMGTMVYKNQSIGFPVFLILLTLNLVSLYRSLRYLKNYLGYSLPKEILDEIKKCGRGTWLSFPMPYMEYLTYQTKKPILWGGHTCDYQNLKKIFPVIRTDLKELMKDYDLRFILAEKSYVQDIVSLPIKTKEIYAGREFTIFELMAEG